MSKGGLMGGGITCQPLLTSPTQPVAGGGSARPGAGIQTPTDGAERLSEPSHCPSALFYLERLGKGTREPKDDGAQTEDCMRMRTLGMTRRYLVLS